MTYLIIQYNEFYFNNQILSVINITRISIRLTTYNTYNWTVFFRFLTCFPKEQIHIYTDRGRYCKSEQSIVMLEITNILHLWPILSIALADDFAVLKNSIIVSNKIYLVTEISESVIKCAVLFSTDDSCCAAEYEDSTCKLLCVLCASEKTETHIGMASLIPDKTKGGLVILIIQDPQTFEIER